MLSNYPSITPMMKIEPGTVRCSNNRPGTNNEFDNIAGFPANVTSESLCTKNEMNLSQVESKLDASLHDSESTLLLDNSVALK